MSAISDDTQDGLAIHKVNHRLLNSGCHSQEIFEQMHRAIANGKLWPGERRPGLRTVRPTGWAGPTPPPGIFYLPRYLPEHSEPFNTNRSKLTGQLERIDGGLEWENRKS